MDTTTEVPFYKKLSSNLLSFTLIVLIFYVSQHILIPLLFSILLATLLLPVTRFLRRKGFHPVISIVVPLLGTIVMIVALLYFITAQVSHFLSDLSMIESRSIFLFNGIKVWVYNSFGISMEAQDAYFTQTLVEIQGSFQGGIIGKTFFTLTGMISFVFFLPIYTFLILHYQDIIKHFAISTFRNSQEEKVKDVLKESLSITQSYMIGMLTELVIVFILNAGGFFLFGIKYALFMGLLVALLNLIPYVGMLVATISCMLITLIACDSLTEVPLVAVVIIVVHLADNAFIMPMVVGSKVRINALAIVVGIIVGGTFFGIDGMFLAIPGLAVLKVMFDRIEGLEPYGMLLGDRKSQPAQKKIKLAGV